MFEKGDSENNLSEVLGPFKLNTSIICLNTSLLHTEKTNSSYLSPSPLSKFNNIKTILSPTSDNVQMCFNEFIYLCSDIYLLVVIFQFQHDKDDKLFCSEHEEFLAAAIICPSFEEEEVMEPILIHFWNSVFSIMIITAILGNLAVLYIVISI